MPLSLGDPVVAARAVRRALAAAGRRAIDVEAMVVASSGLVPEDVLGTFARRALGPEAQRVAVSGLTHSGDADALADVAVRDIAAGSSLLGRGVGIAVGLGSDGTTVALCVWRGP
jgi:hypothetical protein